MRNDFVIKKDYDIVVVGGGIAGIAASVAAARKGTSVLLLEKTVNLGDSLPSVLSAGMSLFVTARGIR